jgi:hypothetical protein
VMDPSLVMPKSRFRSRMQRTVSIESAGGSTVDAKIRSISSPQSKIAPVRT